MQQENSNGRYFAQGPPGEGQGKQPQVLAQAFEELAPGVAEACPEAVATAKASIFQKNGPLRRRQRSALHILLDSCAHQGFEVEIDLMFTILEGLAAIGDAHKLDTEAGLDVFFQAHKDAFKPLLF